MLQFSQTKTPWKFVTPECWLAVLGGVSEPEPSLTLLASGGQEGLWGAPSGLSVRLSPPLLDTDQRSSQLQGSTVPQYHSTTVLGPVDTPEDTPVTWWTIIVHFYFYPFQHTDVKVKQRLCDTTLFMGILMRTLVLSIREQTIGCNLEISNTII